MTEKVEAQGVPERKPLIATLVGRVVSDKMNKTVTVLVSGASSTRSMARS